MKTMLTMMNLTMIDVEKCSNIIYFNFGDKILNGKFYGLSDTEIVTAIKSVYSDKWEKLNEELNTIVGAYDVKKIEENTKVNNNLVSNTDRVKGESALNTEIFIDTDKTNFNNTKENTEVLDKVVTETKINPNLLHKDIVEFKNNICYTIAKDIATYVTLAFY